MDKARYFEFVYRLPESNRVQLKYKEDVYDKQILLNEEWSSFALRCGRSPAVASEEHVKWTTETWDEFEERKVHQKVFLEENEKASEVNRRMCDKRKELEMERSRLVVDHLMQFQARVDKAHTPSTHNLYVDFRAVQQNRFRTEREFVEAHENLLRVKIKEMENDLFVSLDVSAHWRYEICHLRRIEREMAEALEQQRLADEKRRAAEEFLRLEEQRKREEEEVEKQRREQAEIEKRLERKKREEMRRAKSRADRHRENNPTPKSNDDGSNV